MNLVFIISAVWLLLSQAVFGSEGVPSSILLGEIPESEALPIGQRVGVWENLGPAAELEGLSEGSMLGPFESSQKEFPGPSYLRGELWLKILVHNPESTALPLVLESRYVLTDTVDLYQKNLDGRFQVDRQGDRSLQKRTVDQFRSPAFELLAYPGDNVYFLRTSSKGPNILSLYLWDASGFKGHWLRDSLVLGGLFGFLMALFLYNCFLAISFQSRTYIYYSLFLLSMILLQSSMQNVWPYVVPTNWAVWLDNEGYLLIGSITHFTGLLVTLAFLNMKLNLPRMFRCFKVLMAVVCLLALMQPFLPFDRQARLLSGLLGVGNIFILVASVLAMIQGYRPAYYYFISSLIFLAANFLLAANLLGVYHMPHVIQYGNLVGVVVQGLLMSLAIGDRVNFIRAKADLVIRNLNQDLQKHLTQVEAIVAERTETIRTILDNVASGFLIVNRQGFVGEGFSQSCHRLLDEHVQKGEDFLSLLKLSSSQCAIWKLAWQQVFDNTLPTDVALAQLPSTFVLGQRSLRMESKALLGPDGTIQNVLFSIQDVTELRRKQRESRRNRMLIKILRDLEAFRQFISHSYEFVEQLRHCKSKREQAFLLHTLKGNSLVFGLKAVADHLHRLEEARELTSLDIAGIESSFKKFLDLHNPILRTSWGNLAIEARISQVHIQVLKDIMSKRQDISLHRDVDLWIQDVLAKQVSTLISPIFDSCRSMARKLGKSIHFEIIGGNALIRSRPEEQAMEFLVHIIRNAVVHGIEMDRELLGKPRDGKIVVQITENPRNLSVNCRDDGDGFDRSHWEEKALALSGKAAAEIKALTWVELVETASRGGYSTQQEVSLEAGRGVGLEGIIQAIRDLGGHIRIESERGRGSGFYIEMPRDAEAALEKVVSGA